MLRRDLDTTLAQEEIFWKQKSWVAWLKEGERNTCFFHVSTLIRRRRNKVLKLKMADGTWCEQPDALKRMVSDFYQTLYTSEPTASCKSADWHFPQLSHADRRWLNRSVSTTEIHDAIKHMGPFKAPGPDGFPPCFFQRYWHIIGERISHELQRMFATGRIPSNLNTSIICLLPKGENPESLSQFRPISLCNVLLKVITKVTGRYQSSFIAGRSTTDNIIAAQEMVHSLCKRKGEEGAFILKVDLEKAYDRVEWPFLEEVLKITGFNSTLVHLILQCTTSVSMSVSWNGDLLEPFQPTRGLRQGDPLSPTYLYYAWRF